MTAYYNEHDEYAAQWLRNLIAAGHIAPGDVDTRSIEDVKPDDLQPYTQCHFFAGVGVWSLALRRAGWPDDRAIWSGSCPCQPFSAAGQGAAFADERHLWPAFYHLITQRNPSIIVGEQVASSDANAWLDLVSADLEALDFAVGALAFPSAGVGAPHIRDRTYWVAHANHAGPQGWGGMLERAGEFPAGALDLAGRLEHSCGARAGGNTGATLGTQTGLCGTWDSNGRYCSDAFVPAGSICGLADAKRFGREMALLDDGVSGAASGEWKTGELGMPSDADTTTAGPTNGLWGNADWLFCRDGKWRPVRPGSFPLAYGAASRVGRLRAYGNAINVEAARVFIDAAVNAMRECQP